MTAPSTGRRDRNCSVSVGSSAVASREKPVLPARIVSQLARSFVPSVPYGTTAAPKSLNYCAAAMSIAFPTISTGAYGFPPNFAATIAVKTGPSNSRLDLVRFVCFDRATAEIYEELLSG